MANILTADEAARVVSVDSTDEKLLDILPQIDLYIKQSTGRDWTTDAEINKTAKAAARLKLALEYDLMAMQQNQIDALNRSIVCHLTQLESIAIELKAVENVNSCAYVEDMKIYLEGDALGLNLVEYNRLNSGGRWKASESMLNGRPIDGYADLKAIQSAFDTAVRAVI